MLSSVKWKTELKLDGTSESGHLLHLDGDSDHETGASPMELVLMALCGCTAIDVVTILKKKREPFTGLTVSAEGRKAEQPPKVFTHIHLTYRVHGTVSKKAMEDAVHLSETKYCSVAAMLSKTAKIEYSIEHVTG